MLCDLLDTEFEEYCTFIDYYPPVVEDFKINYNHVSEGFFSKYGMKIIASDYSGELSDLMIDDRY